MTDLFTKNKTRTFSGHVVGCSRTAVYEGQTHVVYTQYTRGYYGSGASFIWLSPWQPVMAADASKFVSVIGASFITLSGQLIHRHSSFVPVRIYFSSCPFYCKSARNLYPQMLSFVIQAHTDCSRSDYIISKQGLFVQDPLFSTFRQNDVHYL